MAVCSRQNLSQRFAKHPAVLLKETSNGSSQIVYEMDQSGYQSNDEDGLVAVE